MDQPTKSLSDSLHICKIILATRTIVFFLALIEIVALN